MTADDRSGAPRRSRAEQLRARAEESDEVDSTGAQDSAGANEYTPGTLGAVDDPDSSALLRQWAEEERLETLHPRRNWSPVIAGVVVVTVLAVVVLAIAATWGGDTGEESTQEGERRDAASVLDVAAPSLDDLTSEVTVPPGPDTGLSVTDKGVTIVEDRFDPAKREGTFAAVIDNPNPGWVAQGVQVDVELRDAFGSVVGTDNAFVEVVLPDQSVAVASLFFDAPTVPVADVRVSLDVARWRETGPVGGGFSTRDVVTAPAEYSGVRTTFVLRSSFDDPLTDVGVTAVYRNVFGVIVGGYDTFVDRLEPDTDTPAEIAMLANVPIDQIASTELYPTASFGFVPD